MITVDYIIIALIIASAVIGLFRGFFPELISLVTWIVAVWGGWNLSGLVEPHLAGRLPSPTLELWVARGVVFVAILLLGGLLGQIVAFLIEKTGLSGTDRSLGLAFGLARGVVIFGIVVMIAQLVELEREPWWDRSAMIPIGETVAGRIRAMLPEEVAEIVAPEGELPPETELSEAEEGTI